MDDQTRAGTPAIAASSSLERPFGVGARVRVSRLRTREARGERLGDLGSGRLVEELAVGRPLRVEVAWGPALVTSPVRSVERLGPASVRVLTVNSVYRLERVEPDAALPPPPSPPEQPAELVLEEVVDSTTTGPVPRQVTQYVSLNDLTDAERAPFGAGVRVSIGRRKPLSTEGEERFESVGTGQLLDPVEAGAPVRLAVDNGPTFVTSPVRRLRLLEPDEVEFETTNSVYRLERLRSS